MDKKEIINKIEKSDIKPSIIIDGKGNTIIGFLEQFDFENDVIEYQTIDGKQNTIPVSDVISVFNSKDLFPLFKLKRDSCSNTAEKNYVIKRRTACYEEGIVKRFPYTLLIRFWSLVRMAEEKPLEFYDEYDKYITATGETCEEPTVYEDIPLTDDGKYLLNLVVEDFMVRDFSILRNPPFEKFVH